MLSDGDRLPPETAAYLASERGIAQFALGGPAAGADPAATPLVGADRYATSVVVAERFFTKPAIVGFANGFAFADALSGAASDISEEGRPPDPRRPGRTARERPPPHHWCSIAATLRSGIVYGGTLVIPTFGAGSDRAGPSVVGRRRVSVRRRITVEAGATAGAVGGRQPGCRRGLRLLDEPRDRLRGGHDEWCLKHRPCRSRCYRRERPPPPRLAPGQTSELVLELNSNPNALPGDDLEHHAERRRHSKRGDRTGRGVQRRGRRHDRRVRAFAGRQCGRAASGGAGRRAGIPCRRCP